MAEIEAGLCMQSKLKIEAYNDKGNIGNVEKVVNINFLDVLKNIVKEIEGEKK